MFCPKSFSRQLLGLLPERFQTRGLVALGVRQLGARLGQHGFGFRALRFQLFELLLLLVFLEVQVVDELLVLRRALFLRVHLVGVELHDRIEIGEIAYEVAEASRLQHHGHERLRRSPVGVLVHRRLPESRAAFDDRLLGIHGLGRYLVDARLQLLDVLLEGVVVARDAFHMRLGVVERGLRIVDGPLRLFRFVCPGAREDPAAENGSARTQSKRQNSREHRVRYAPACGSHATPPSNSRRSCAAPNADARSTIRCSLSVKYSSS